ncbi:MAG: NUDIX hydrolase [Gammaproteobacteria bacterium]
MSWPLHITVAAVVVQEDRFLLVQESVSGQSVINQPAGHLEQHENLVQAVVRETLEETAWQFEPTALVGIYRWLHPRGDTYLRFCFTGELVRHDPERRLDHGIEEVVWFTREELQARKQSLRSPLVLQCIDDYLAGSRIDLSVIKDID